MFHAQPRLFLTVSLLLLLAACAARPAGLLRPNGVAIAPDGSLYVMDRGHQRVVHLTADGRWLGAFGQLGLGPHDIYQGWNIALDGAGHVYICNFRYNEKEQYIDHDGVKVFTPQGRFVREVGGQDYPEALITPDSPYGLDVDEQGRVYVGYFMANTVRVFDAEGKLIARFFGETGNEDGQFSGVNDVAVDSQRGLLYVTDVNNSRVQQFNLSVTDSGELTVTHRLSFGSYGREPGQFAYALYLAVEQASGRVYVSDMGNRRIQVFDSDGQYLAGFAPPQVKIWQPLDLGVGSDGAVYVADAFNNVLWVFEPDGRLRRRIEVKQ